MNEGEAEVGISVDLEGDDLTLNEKLLVEQACGGRPFAELREQGGTAYHRALVWVALRRTSPSISLHEAGELKVRLDG